MVFFFFFKQNLYRKKYKDAQCVAVTQSHNRPQVSCFAAQRKELDMVYGCLTADYSYFQHTALVCVLDCLYKLDINFDIS